MKKKIFSSFMSLLALHGFAQQHFQKTETYEKYEKAVDEGRQHKLPEFGFFDNEPGVSLKPTVNVRIDDGFHYVKELMADSTECAKLIKEGPNVINVHNGVILIDYNQATNQWTLDFREKYMAVGDDTRPVRFFIKTKGGNSKKGVLRDALAKL